MKNRQRQKDTLFSILIFCSAFAINLLIQKLFTTQTLVPMIFVFGVFLISLKTHGYCYGIISAIISVFAVNFAFTYPYYAFDFFVEESILSAVIMLIVAVSTSTLNIRIRDQEKLRSENEKERMRGNLLRAISHDLRTPLTSIYGSSSTLISKYDALPKEQQLKLLGEIQEDSEWLIRMVENLLSVTRIDGAKVEVVKTPTVLDELIGKAVLDHYADAVQPGQIHVESHVVLAEDRRGTETVTVYLLVLQEIYSTDGESLTLENGSYIPTAITFSLSTSSGAVTEYWEPSDGSYSDDIRAKFLPAAAEEALQNDQAYIDDLKTASFQKALEANRSAAS